MDRDRPWMDPDLDPGRRADLLLARMDLEERVGQLVQIAAASGSGREAAALVRAGRVGSRIIAENAFAGNAAQRTEDIRAHQELQRIAVAESRLGIPLLFARDVIHGHRTIFPIPIAQAATWDPALLQAACRIAAEEAAGDGVRWTFAPMVDIARDPRWSRIAEGFGEDPWLAGTLGAAAVRGYQGEEGVPVRSRILACAKHYLAYGSGLGGRDYHAAEVADHVLRNVHLPPFLACLEAGAASVMSGFHQVDGWPMTASTRLLRGWLRDRHGFDGIVISDWGAVAELEEHGCSAGAEESTAQAMAAGVDVDMCSDRYRERLAGLVRAGAVPAAWLEAAVRRMLRAKFRLGLFERPFTDPDAARPRRAESLALARRQAAQAVTLLRNDGDVLPLAPARQRIALIGPAIDDGFALIGCWSSAGRDDETPSIAAAARAAWPADRLRMARVVDDYGRVVQASEVVVLVLGEYPSRTGENQSVLDPGLPWGQAAVLDAVIGFGKPVVLVVIGARPLVLPPGVELCAAVVWAWHGGNEAAAALIEVLDGRREPGGRLPVTIPRHAGQIPIFHAPQRRGRPAPPCGVVGDGIPEPRWRFGEGLGYTRFALEDVRLTDARIAPGGATTVAAVVRNLGARDGATVVQCYVRDEVAAPARPERELRGFIRVELAAGASCVVRLPLGERELGSFGEDGAWRVQPGEFSIGLGFDSGCALDLRLRVG